MAAQTENIGKTSKTISAVLREPLPPEEINLSKTAAEFVISGPTFTCRVQRKTGAISGIKVVRDEQEVITSIGPADIQIDRHRLASELNSCKLSVVSKGKDKIVLRAQGVLHDPAKPEADIDYTVLHTFFNDGVVVSGIKLVLRNDLKLEVE